MISVRSPVLAPVLVLLTSVVCGQALDEDLLVHWVFDRAHLQGSRIEPASGEPWVDALGELQIDRESPESIVLDGETTSLRVAGEPEALPLPAFEFTVAAWIRVDSAGDWGGIVSAIQDNGDFEKGWLLGLNASRFTFGLSTRGVDDGNGKITYVHAATRMSRGRWYHVAATYDGVLQQLFVDGRLEGVDVAQHGEINYPRRVPFELGAYRDDDEQHRLAGRLREVRIYTRRLADAEIEALYSDPAYAAVRAAATARPAPEDSSRTPASSDWPTYLADARRSGVSGSKVSLPLVERWRHHPRRPPRASWPPPATGSYWQRLPRLEPRVVHDRAFHPVASSGRVYFASSSEDQVVCLDGDRGRVLWTFFTDGPVRFAPALAEGRLFAGSDDGHVYCLDAASGELQWKRRVAPSARQIVGNGRLISAWPIRTGLLVDDGAVLATAGLFPSQGVYATSLSATDGTVIWRRRLEGQSPQGYLLASKTRIYVPSGRAQPFALRRRDGEYLRSFKSTGGAYALLTGDSLISGPGDEGTLQAADTKSSDQLATFNGRHLVVDGARSYLHSETELRAIDRRSFVRLGERRRGLTSLLRRIDRIARDERARRPEVAARLGRHRERLAAELQQVSRDLRSCVSWSVDCRHPLSLILAGETLFAGGRGEVGAYSTQDGTLRWTGRVDGDALGLAVAEGRLLVSTEKGTIHAFASTASETLAIDESGDGPSETPRADRYTASAQRILERAALRQGICLVIGNGSGRLAAALARQSSLTVLGVDRDPEQVSEARVFLASEGLYGERVAVQSLSSEALPFTDYFANLIVSEEFSSSGKLAVPAAEAYRVLRPDGGVLVLERPSEPPGTQALREWGAALEGWSWSADGRVASLRKGSLPGSGEWTHQYADPGNTASSRDELVRPSTRIQWFGGPGPRRMVDRHLRTVAPLVVAGRLFIPGNQLVIAVDAYNGTELWQIDVPGSRRVGAPYDASYMAATRDTLYVAAGDECWAIDARTGTRSGTFRVPRPADAAGDTRHWGYVAVVGDSLFGSGQSPTASRRDMSREEVVDQYREFRPLVTSDGLFCFDRVSGELRWFRRDGRIVNNTLTIGGGRVYYVAGRLDRVDSESSGRATLETLLTGEARLVALDSTTGEPLWERAFDHDGFRHILFLSYSDDILVASGSTNQSRTTLYSLRAFRADDGREIWSARHPNSREGIGGDHGEQVHHPVITGQLVVSEPWAFDLHSGKRLNPGGASPMWTTPRRSGCGTLSASSRCLYFRDSHPAVLDLEAGGPARKLTQASRPGCWISIIPAGGLVLLPEASSGCVCPFPLQTSMALLPVDP